MEGSSLNSMKGRTTSVDHRHEKEEESGWTTYLEDFSKHQFSSGLEHRSSSCSSFSTSTSLVSDAASRYHDPANSSHRSPPNRADLSTGQKKLSLTEKESAKKGTEEDPLEDTASSPVSSPKIDDRRRMNMISRRANDLGPNFFGSGGGSSYHHHGLEMETSGARNEMMPKGQDWDSCTSLKNGGQCLVPLSLFLNYLD